MTSRQLEAWRKSRHLSQAQAAKILHVSLRTYCGWETTKNPPSSLDALTYYVDTHGKVPHDKIVEWLASLDIEAANIETGNQQKYLTVPQFAKLMGIPVNTFRRRVKKNPAEYPPSFEIEAPALGQAPWTVWDATEVNEWIKSQKP